MTYFQKYRSDIDGLRAVAVLSVVFYHAFPNWMKGGFIGVDIFFVISGYLICGIIFNSLKNNNFSFIDFYIRRIKRIFPTLIIILTFCLIFGWYFLLSNEYTQLGKHVISGAGFFSNFVLWQESNYFDIASEAKPLLHLWSLSIEEQFYLIWPPILFILWKKKYNLVTFTLSVAFVSFVLNVIFIHHHSVAVFYLPITRFWEILMGSILSYIELSRKNQIYPTKEIKFLEKIKPFLGTALIIFALFGLNRESTFPGWWALLPTLGTVLIISAGENAWINRKILSHPKVVWFGLISYPLYLWHWPLLSFSKIITLEMNETIFKSLIILTSILLAWICYKYIEIPIRFYKPKRTKKIAFHLGYMLAIIAFSGYYLNIKNGLPSRLPQIIQQIDDTWFGDAVVMKEWKQECFLARDQKPEKFSENCWDKNKRPLVFLWGDSHAAALYPGLKFLKTKFNFGIAVYTASICPPILNWNSWYHYYCKEINNTDLSVIKKIKPEIILLHSNWVTAHYDWHRLHETVNELKKIGISKIILIGPVPQWSPELPNIIYSYYKKFRSLPPEQTRVGLNNEGKDVHDVDLLLQKEAKKLDISYISAFQTLCNQNGCRMRTGDKATDMTTFDGGHLSPSGSRKLMNLISDKIFESHFKNGKLSAKSSNVP